MSKIHDLRAKRQQAAGRQSEHLPERTAQVCRTGEPGRMRGLGQVAALGDRPHDGGHLAPEPVAAERQPERGIEALFTLGDLCVHSAQAFGAARHFADMDRLLAAVTAQVDGFQSVVVKGSRFMKMERVVQALLSRGEDQNSQNNKKGESHAA